jgi:hypothetical protein
VEEFEARHLNVNLWNGFEGDWTKADLDNGSIIALVNLLWRSEEDGANFGGKMCGGPVRFRLRSQPNICFLLSLHSETFQKTGKAS